MNIMIEDKGNTSFKLTVTSNNEVRIKLKSSDPDDFQMISCMKRAAAHIIDTGLNKTTLRGKCRKGDTVIVMFNDSKKFRYVIDLFDDSIEV